MADVGTILADIIDLLTPIHEAEARAIKGGSEAGKLIARLYQMAVEAKACAYDQGDVDEELEVVRDALEEREEEINAAKEALAAAQAEIARKDKQIAAGNQILASFCGAGAAIDRHSKEP